MNGNTVLATLRPPVYFGRAIDGIPGRQINELTRRATRKLAAAGLQILDPYATCGARLTLHDDGIVDCCLHLLAGASALLVDMTIPDRNYVGSICEIVYARIYGLPVVVYVDRSGHGRRLWLRHHASSIVDTQDEAIATLVSILTNEDR